MGDLEKILVNEGDANLYPEVAGDPPPIPFCPYKKHVSERKIFDAWFRYAPECKNFPQLVTRVCEETGASAAAVERAIKRASLRQMAREQRELITQELFKDKIPIAKSIVGLSLRKLEQFLARMKPSDIKNIYDATQLQAIAANVNSLLRLESGKSTSNVDVHVAVMAEKDATTILGELRANDPFMDYPVSVAEVKDVKPG